MRVLTIPTAGFALLASFALLGSRNEIFADVEGYRFVFPELVAEPGDELTLTVSGEYERSTQGFVFAATFPSSLASIDRVHFDDTILESLEVDFFDVTVSPTEGFFVVSALIDTRPPFDGQLIPNIGSALPLFHIELEVRPDASSEIRIKLEDGLATPPVNNVFTVDNESVRVTELNEGLIIVDDGGSSTGTVEIFLRGDANLSGQTDIADPISVLGFSFAGDVELDCLQAADANDDDSIDVSDAIYVLHYLFGDGLPPPPPVDFPDSDPTPGRLTCETGLE